MELKSMRGHLGKWLVAAALAASAGWAMAQAEPSLNQVYATAQAGKLDEAQVMIQQVLVSHPKSAKAFFVQAELYARQGRIDRARESLATAEQLSPGLAFAKPEAVSALHAQLTAKPLAKAAPSAAVNHAAPAAASSGNSWAIPLLLAGGVMVAGYFIFRRKTPQAQAQPQHYANQNPLTGQQSFGAGGAGAMQPAGYYPPQQTGSGLGGRIMGGVATGLAVGAGVMAAEAIGKSLMGDHRSSGSSLDSNSNNDYQPVNSNPDMGGANFGVNDGGSWDDGGSADGGGGDWDN